MRRFLNWLITRQQRVMDAVRTRKKLDERIESLTGQVSHLINVHQREIESLQSRIQLLEIERDKLLEIVERDRERVRAEIANYAAAKELAAHRTIQSIGQMQ